jgi:plastocyanin
VIKLIVLGAVSAGLVAPAASAPARLGVTAKGYRFSLSRTTLKRGPAVIELDNFGEDVHDLRLRRVGGTRTYGATATKPGERDELDVRLRPGVYRLWCSIADHRARGMVATLRVR